MSPTASTALQLRRPAQASLSLLPLVPWRDPQTVSPEQLSGYIQMLEIGCRDHPSSADLHTCLGMAYAMNYDVYRSMDALEQAVRLDAAHFFAQLKYAELLYRIRTLRRAEEETLKAVNLASNPWELSLARTQLKEIRALLGKGHERPPLTKSLRLPLLLFSALSLACLALRLFQ